MKKRISLVLALMILLSLCSFARTAAEKVLRAVVREEPSASVEELIRMALKRL